ncbi:PQQ-dependent sugar dehydrogenase [Euzebya sp.]|uniref:PQQ-dependent sugar dehydrogenase n=1 Tax=Euzebya sp. TaxID=1971409 RepID=UPI0035193D46
MTTPRLLLALALVAALTATAGPPPATAQEPTRIGDAEDPVAAAVAINQARDPDGGSSPVAVVGRADAFPDTLAATALAGRDGALLLTDGGPGAALRPEVAAELERTMAPGTCPGGDGPTVYVVGGVDAVSQQAEDALAEGPWCVERLAGPTRLETAVALGDAIGNPSDTVVLARADDWADAGAVGAWAAATSSRVLVTDGDALSAPTAAALERWQPARIVLVGGEAALSAAVADAAATHAEVRRVAGAARDATAVAIAEDLWGGDRSDVVVLADGYGAADWTYLFAVAPLAAQRGAPVLYTAEDQPTPATRAHLDARPPAEVLVVGPDDSPPPTDLGSVAVGLQPVVSLDSPVMLKARPDTGELWVAELGGRVQAIGPTGVRTVLDLTDTVSTGGERGLLGMAFDPAGTRLFTSSTDDAGDTVIDLFALTADGVDAASRTPVLRVDQPASNHNGGDLVWGPDDNLWWALGDGGGSGDTYGNGQDTSTLLGGLVRIDVRDLQPGGGQRYAIPADNPFTQGGGAPELYTYGLRNPFRFSFDPETELLYIADVGQGAVEEIDVLDIPGAAGANMGWPIFEGSRPFAGGDLGDHVGPVHEELHRDGSCSITGGVVYRGQAIEGLDGAYLYSDLCRSSVRAIVVEGGQVTQAADLGVSVPSPVGFGVDGEGEVYVMSLEGQVLKVVPA